MLSKSLEPLLLPTLLTLVTLLGSCRGTREDPRLNIFEATFRDNALELLKTAPADTMMSFHIRLGAEGYVRFLHFYEKRCEEDADLDEVHGLYTERGDLILEWHGQFSFKAADCFLNIADYIPPGDDEGSLPRPAIKVSMRIEDAFAQINVLRIVVQRGGLNSPGAPAWLQERVKNNLKDNQVLLAARWGAIETTQELVATMDNYGEGVAWLRFQNPSALGRAEETLEAAAEKVEQEVEATSALFAIQATENTIRVGGNKFLLRLLLRALLETRRLTRMPEMSPTFQPLDHTFTAKTAFVARPWKRGDIVQFSLPQAFASERVMARQGSDSRCDPRFLFENKNKVRFGRIIGLPGDKIDVFDGFIRLNGENASYTTFPTHESITDRDFNVEVLPGNALPHRVYTAKASVQKESDPLEFRVPPEQVFVLVDDRSFMVDSRCWGTLPVRYIDGLVHTLGYGWTQENKFDWSQAFMPL